MVIQYPFFICRTSQNKTQSIHLFNVNSSTCTYWNFRKRPWICGHIIWEMCAISWGTSQVEGRVGFLLLLHLWSRTFPSFPNCWTKSIPNIFHMSTAIKQELKQCRWVHKFNKTLTLIIKSTELWFKWNKTKIKPKLKQKPSIILSCFK